MEISHLFTYPVKSAGAIHSQSVVLDQYGFLFDRFWAIINQKNQVITARTHPILLTIGMQFIDNNVVMTLNNQRFILNQLLAKSQIELTLFNKATYALLVDSKINQALSQFLGEDVRVVFVDQNNMRESLDDNKKKIAFADGYSIMLLSDASIADLNSRLEFTVDARRFRPNIVIKHCPAYEENSIKKFKIGSMIFDQSDPCARCTLINANPITGKKDTKHEPLSTLSKYRKLYDGDIIFGQNFTSQDCGTIQVGDQIQIIQ